MANSYIEYTSGLTATTYSVPFNVLSITDVNVKGYNGTTWSDLTVSSRDAVAKTITLSGAPSAFQKIRVWRNTGTTQLVDFQNGSRLSESDLDTAYQQGLFVAQEVSENASTTVEGIGPQGQQGIQGVAGTSGTNGTNASPFPAGSVIYHAANTAPSGFLKADGATVSRSTYSALFAAIGTTYGAGNGSTTFLVPDLRGEFMRGWDDSRGVDGSRGFGSTQGDAIRNITGSVSGHYGNGSLLSNNFTNASGALSTSGNSARANNAAVATSAGNSTFSIDASLQVPTAAENRPRNVALLACIKF